MRKDLLNGRYLQADETTVPVQMHDGRGKNHEAYLRQYWKRLPRSRYSRPRSGSWKGVNKMGLLLSLCAVAIAIWLCNHLVIDREVRADKAEASRRMAEHQRRRQMIQCRREFGSLTRILATENDLTGTELAALKQRLEREGLMS